MKQRRLLPITLILIASLCLSGCLGQTRRVREADEDDDDFSFGKTHTEQTEETETVIETSVLSEEEAYLQIMNEYDRYMHMVEDMEGSGYPSCSYIDITSDGIPELFILYAADEENGSGITIEEGYYVSATMRIFTYDQEEGEAVEMLCIPNAVVFAGAGTFTDVVLLQDGSIVTFSSTGDLELFISDYNRYEVHGNELVLIENYEQREEIIDWDNEVYNITYTLNGVEITEDEYNAARQDFEDNAIVTIESAPWYGEYSEGSWEQTLLGLDTATIMYDDLFREFT